MYHRGSGATYHRGSGATTKLAPIYSKHACQSFVELCVFTLATTNSFTAEEKRSIVTKTGPLVQVSVERQPFYLYHSINAITSIPSLF